MAFEHKMGIVAVIHQNPGSAKECGHIGTLLAKKTTGYLSLTRHGDSVKVSCGVKCRDEPFPDFYIRFDSDTHTIVEDRPSACVTMSAPMPSRKVAPKSQKGKTRGPGEKTIEMAHSVPLLFFEEEFSVAKSVMVQRLSTKYAIPCRNRTQAYRIINYALASEIIKEGETPNTIERNDEKSFTSHQAMAR